MTSTTPSPNPRPRVGGGSQLRITATPIAPADLRPGMLISQVDQTGWDSENRIPYLMTSYDLWIWIGGRTRGPEIIWPDRLYHITIDAPEAPTDDQ